MELWNKLTEKRFFSESLASFSSPEQLFYVTESGKYLAYWPKNYKEKKTTLQSRNSLIGNFTEKWTSDILKPFAKKNNLYAIQGANCFEIALPKNSSADVALCKTKSIIQKPENIIVIFEVKMSIVWNWELSLKEKDNEFNCIGDYTTHQGNPGLLRSDSMLKAIGKSVNIRVASNKSSHIPIIILGNTPITKNYYQKVDHLKKSGVIQGFWSLNPNPTDKERANIKNTKHNGFRRFDSDIEFESALSDLLREEQNFFLSMKSKKKLGQIIELANKEIEYEKKAEKFLSLLKEE